MQFTLVGNSHVRGLFGKTLRWRHNGRDSVSNLQPHNCLLNRLFRRRSKKTSKLRVTGLCVGNSPGTGEFPAQMASTAENVSIWWRHHEMSVCRESTVKQNKTKQKERKTTHAMLLFCSIAEHVYFLSYKASFLCKWQNLIWWIFYQQVKCWVWDISRAEKCTGVEII